VLYQRRSGDLPTIGYLVVMDHGFFTLFGLAIYLIVAAVVCYVADKRKLPRLGRTVNLIGLLLTPAVLLAMTLVVVQRYGSLS
jgi:hypothetical protein